MPSRHQEPFAAGLHRVTVGDRVVEIETPPDFDALLDQCAAETPDNVDLIPYYAMLWPSALALADALWLRRGALAGRRVIELGCGLGLPSIVAGLLGAGVTATDFHPATGAWLQRNAARNGLTIPYIRMAWDEAGACGRFDWVMGSDLLYEGRHIAALAAAIATLAAPGGAALIADPGRDGLAELTAAMAGQGWQASLEPHGEIYVVAFTRP